MKQQFRKICMIGLGYIGLPTAAIMASRGLKVVGVDVNRTAVETINKGKIHIVEPDLDIVVRSVVQTGQLKATTTPEAADAFLIAVPTPLQKNHTPDLSYIQSAAEVIAPVLKKKNLVVLESTSPVGTTEKLSSWLAKERPDLTFPQQDKNNPDISVAHCPERVLPGRVLQELVSNDRVIGGMTPRCAQGASQLYKTFVRGECVITNARTAELSKLSENAYRDVNIAFANELSLVCEDLHVNVWEMIELANRHPRVNILQPGPGVGGHCIAVDPWFIIDSSPDRARLIRTAREVNDFKPDHVLEKIKTHSARFKNPNIACFGLSFKADIDDLRESPALKIVEQLARQELGTLLVVEPHIKELPAGLQQRSGTRKVDLDQAMEEADIVVGLVDHNEFKEIDQDLLQEKIVIDLRGMWR